MNKQYLIDDYSVAFFPNDMVMFEDGNGNKYITTVERVTIGEFGVNNYYLTGFMGMFFATALTKVY
jgi:hypothetical protein